MFCQTYFLLHSNVQQSVVAIIAALVGMIPEGLYLLTSVALVVSVMRLGKKNVLVHEMACVETLARVNVLCVDKTGTITENKMTVNEVVPIGMNLSKETVVDKIGNLVSVLDNDNNTMNTLKEYFTKSTGLKAIKTFGFSSETKFSSAQMENGDNYVIGAPERVLLTDYCNYQKQIEEYARRGMRVLIFGIYDGQLDGHPLEKPVIPMAIVVLLIVPFCMMVLGMVIKKSQAYFVSQQALLGDMNGHVEEIYGGHDIVKAFNGEEKAGVRFNEINHDLYHSAWKSQFLSTMMHPIMGFIGNLSYVVVSIFGSYMVIKDKIVVGDILSFTQYSRTFMQQISQLSQIMNMVQQTLAASERVFEFLAEPEEVDTTKKKLPVSTIKGNIDFDHVHFGYNEDHIIINDFSAKVKSGAKVAIVGPTGAGKSTMIKLLMRFYDVNSGSIKVDGHDIRDFDRQELRSLFGMVLQDTWLFSGTIADNIRYGKLDATLDEVKEACKTASVDHFIKTLPDGYDMLINEDADNISGGQKQLLTIARVILADPKILILDEATSSVDTRTELLIQEAMDKLMEGRTSFIIAHRLSTIKNADLIIVMNEGDIVETGNHEALLAKDGFYAKLYNSQFEEVE